MEKFYLPEDTHHPEWAREGTDVPHPMVWQHKQLTVEQTLLSDRKWSVGWSSSWMLEHGPLLTRKFPITSLLQLNS